MTDFKVTLDEWFAQTGGGGLVLPDGWFGRPHDNIHRLTFAAVRPCWLIVELDSRLLLTFRDVKDVLRENGELVVRGFSSLVLDRKEYGSERGHVRHYPGGTVKLVPPPGP